MADASLLVVLDEARKRTLRVIDGVPPRHAMWTPPGEVNHILWHAGHIYCMVERVTTAALTGNTGVPESLPEGWWHKFGWSSKPAKIPQNQWPGIDQVTAHLYEQHHRLRDFLENIGEGELRTAPGGGKAPNPHKTTRGLILHAFHDEAYHAGQIWLLKKLLVYDRQARSNAPTATRA